MPWQEVEPDPYVASGDFFRFKVVGDRLAGWWTGKAPSTGQFGGINYMVLTREGARTVTAKGQLLKQLEKAERTGMKVGMAIMLECKGLQDIGKENPMPIMRVAFDPSRMQPAARPHPPQQQPPPRSAAPSYNIEDPPF